MRDWYSDAITAVFVLAMFVVYFAVSSKRRRSNLIPTIITTLGILGTFVGITWGLFNFDVSNVQGSIPKLLEGLKIAFFTSIAGMAIAILIRLYNFHQAGKEERAEGATIDTLAQLLKEQNDALAQQNQPLLEMLGRIEHSLVGDGDSTLITQLQKMRTGLGDKLDDHLQLHTERYDVITATLEAKSDQLISEFQTFAEKMAENNSKALIRALEEVIRDFNAKINEQFGDNFKQLNEAVGKLLTWQEQYRQQMNDLMDRFNIMGESFDNIEKNLRNTSEQISAVLELVDELDGFMQTAKVHLDALSQSIEAHAHLADKANLVFPEIEERISQLTGEFGRAVQVAVETNQEAVAGLQAAVREQSTFVTEHTSQMSKTAQKVVSELDATIVELIRKNNSHVQHQFSQFAENMSNEMQKALSTLGSQLASLSGKFVSDYAPLTEKLRRLIEIAGDGDRGN